jgi:hypothetical protein
MLLHHVMMHWWWHVSVWRLCSNFFFPWCERSMVAIWYQVWDIQCHGYLSLFLRHTENAGQDKGTGWLTRPWSCICCETRSQSAFLPRLQSKVQHKCKWCRSAGITESVMWLATGWTTGIRSPAGVFLYVTN